MNKMILVVVLALFGIALVNAQDQVVVYGTIKNAKRDTVKIILIGDLVTRRMHTVFVKMENGSFRQTIPLKQHIYISVEENGNYTNGLMKPGDDIGIEYDANDRQNSLSLKGKAKEKFEWINAFSNARLNAQLVTQAKIAREKQYPFDYLYKYVDSIGDHFISRLQPINDVDPVGAHILKGQMEGSVHSQKFFGTTYIFSESISETLEKRGSLLTPASRNIIAQLLTLKEENYNSTHYVNSVYNVLSVNYENLVFSKQMAPDLTLKYRFIDSLLPGKLKVPIMTIFLGEDIRKTNQGEDIQRMIDYVFAYPAEPMYREFIDQQLARNVLFKKGSSAPAFTLENEKGEKISLASFKGKVVYMDFWFATCGPCHSLFAGIKPVKEHFKENKDIIFLTISIDDRNRWKDALKKFRIPGYHAFTENKEREHAIIKDYKVQEYPTTFLIDKNGNIFLARPSSNPDELKNQIEEALK